LDAPPPPRRRLSQNFLVDRGAVSRIVAALDPRPGEALLEIGPGRGALTAALVEPSPPGFAPASTSGPSC
jgi:16S rRNA (adenine1518-N6/adenine1519-N6)-dimethyltransferase